MREESGGILHLHASLSPGTLVHLVLADFIVEGPSIRVRQNLIRLPEIVGRTNQVILLMLGGDSLLPDLLELEFGIGSFVLVRVILNDETTKLASLPTSRISKKVKDRLEWPASGRPSSTEFLLHQGQLPRYRREWYP